MKHSETMYGICVEVILKDNVDEAKQYKVYLPQRYTHVLRTNINIFDKRLKTDL